MKYANMFLILMVVLSCNGQQIPQLEAPSNSEEVVGGPFENRELFFEGRQSVINSVDTSLLWHTGKNRLKISGTIYQRDGKTPVHNVQLYYYHTDEDGLYSGGGKHGKIRGWVQTDEEGRYAIYTSRPAMYPNGREPAHIHPAILEPGFEYPYYIDAFIFDDDKLVNTAYRNAMENRGGSGVLRLFEEDGIMQAKHDIILGLNIPGHPSEKTGEIHSGPEIGEDMTAFNPNHIWGNDKGTKTCPICKYGLRKGILFFAEEGLNKQDVRSSLNYLESLASGEFNELKYFYISPGKEEELSKLVKEMKLGNIAVATIDQVNLVKNEIDATKGNTIIFYHRSRVVDKLIIDDITDAARVELKDKLERFVGR